MKRVIIMTIVALISMGTYAQNATKARQILDKTASIVNNKDGASASFKISGETTGTVSGTIAIKGNKFRATTPEASVWYNGKTQWTYMKENEEVNVSNPTEAQQAKMNPYTFITLYKKGYTLGMTNVKAGYQVHLTAQDKSRAIQEMYITVNSKTYLPSTVKMKTKGKWTTINISNFKAVKQSDASFTFNSKDFPEAEVIDLR